MNTNCRSGERIRRAGRAIVALLLITMAAGHAAAQSSECTCSCDNYTKLMQVVEEFEAQQKSGQPQGIPPELMQMSMCAGQCAMQWAQCQNPDLDLGEIQRARDAAQLERNEYSGDAAIARERSIGERSIGETEKNLQPDATRRSGDRLTTAYLKGMWCSVYGGQEKAQWRFDGNGSYEVGLPAGNGWAMQKSGDSIGEFRERFERLIDLQADTFTTEHRHGRRNVFTRGPCN